MGFSTSPARLALGRMSNPLTHATGMHIASTGSDATCLKLAQQMAADAATAADAAGKVAKYMLDAANGASLTDFNMEEYKQRVSDAADAAATAAESAKAYAEVCLKFWNS